MIVDFSELPKTSKVWIFQSNRSLNDEELQSIQTKLTEFLSQWTAHGADLKAGFEFRYKRFIVVALDQNENKATGCSIDTLIHFVQAIETAFSIDLLDKMNVSYKQGEFIAYKNLVDFKTMAKKRSVSPKTIVFNNLVVDKADYQENWEIPASESWHARFF
ncbi:MAG: ABC transporter ATPase [Flavobacteriaceae bacterium]|jgi:hypothetical protein|nr:ABC transporter ATPase [Flavobacteriaceae bacterium]MDG2313873.1 ABC transporter ATPase [Flavobacteriaceae bacterium]